MASIIVINLLLGFFDNRLFFDVDYIKYLKYKHSMINVEYKGPEIKFEFYKRISQEVKPEKINLFMMKKPKPVYPYVPLNPNLINKYLP